MIIYNTTFHVEEEVLSEWLDYLKKDYIPSAICSGFLHTPHLSKVLNTGDIEGHNFAIQFNVKNVDTLNYWMEQEGSKLHEAMVNRFGRKIAGFTTLLEDINLQSE